MNSALSNSMHTVYNMSKGQSFQEAFNSENFWNSMKANASDLGSFAGSMLEASLKKDEKGKKDNQKQDNERAPSDPLKTLENLLNGAWAGLRDPKSLLSGAMNGVREYFSGLGERITTQLNDFVDRAAALATVPERLINLAGGNGFNTNGQVIAFDAAMRTFEANDPKNISIMLASNGGGSNVSVLNYATKKAWDDMVEAERSGMTEDEMEAWAVMAAKNQMMEKEEGYRQLVPGKEGLNSYLAEKQFNDYMDLEKRGMNVYEVEKLDTSNALKYGSTKYYEDYVYVNSGVKQNFGSGLKFVVLQNYIFDDPLATEKQKSDGWYKERGDDQLRSKMIVIDNGEVVGDFIGTPEATHTVKKYGEGKEGKRLQEINEYNDLAPGEYSVKGDIYRGQFAFRIYQDDDHMMRNNRKEVTSEITIDEKLIKGRSYDRGDRYEQSHLLIHDGSWGWSGSWGCTIADGFKDWAKHYFKTEEKLKEAKGKYILVDYNRPGWKYYNNKK